MADGWGNHNRDYSYGGRSYEDRYSYGGPPRSGGGWGEDDRGQRRPSGGARGPPRSPVQYQGSGSFFNDDLYTVQLAPEDYSNAPSFQKSFYDPHPVVKTRHPRDVEDYRMEKQISVFPQDSPNPVTSFEEAGLPEYIMETVVNAGFVEPTPIQAQSFPICLSGFDMIGLAETGSGKTLAYMLPAIIHMLHQPELYPGDGPICLIVAPTRELSCQILEECDKFGKPCGVKSTCAYGGAPKTPQIRDLRNGVHLVVATPGRLIDMLNCGATNLRRVTYLVLDEADRMLDMGFEPQIRKIVGQVRTDRQTLLWSATWPREVEGIAAEYLNNPYKVTIGSEHLRANHNIIQKFQIISNYEKFERLVDLLNHEASGHRVLIFCRTKRNVDDVTKQLRLDGWPALCIHGDKAQPEREWVLQEFKSGSSPILLATDVAARGLDIKDVKCVVNYDMPMTGEDYVHRIGRTGRAGARGMAYSFFTDEDTRIVKQLIHVIQEAGQEPPAELHRIARRSNGGFATGSNSQPARGQFGNGW